MLAFNTYAEVLVSGVSGKAKDNVMLSLSLEKEKCDASKWKIQHTFDDSEREIDEALRALGYYHAVTKKSLVFNDACWRASFDIDAGSRVVLSDVSIIINGDAKNDTEFLSDLDKLRLKQGSSLHHGKYETMKSKIESLALGSGYLQSEFTEKKLFINKQNNTAQIQLVFNTGKRMKIGNVVIKQNILDADYVNKYLTIKPGDIYSSEQLAKTHNALAQSGYFDIVDIRSDLENIQQQRVPVTITLTPKKKTHYALGIGYDTDVGLLLNGSYINHLINKQGHFFTANIDVSPVLSVAEMLYTIPLANPTTDFLTFGTGLKREDNDSFKSLSAALSVRHKHAYDSGWKQTVFLDYTYEDFTIGPTNGQTLLLVPGANWLRSVSNNPLRPSNGYRLEAEVKGSVKLPPVSDASFLQGYFSGIWLHDLPLKGKFIGRTLLGATLVDNITDLSTSYRFYAGGLNSVRGYAYKELGPKDKFGYVEGGKFLTVVSAEYEQAIYDNWAVAAFVDTGNAFNADSIQLKTGVGLGVRWYSPVGPVRVDFAIPLNESDSSFQIHFATGARL
ncbi:autotransporter assembly complex family protein [Crenothrix sp.]|uniref:autotransporter assembly complex protein TamA n=1 Tax=Crenothrix sp. TaxID=3100433 RepID=UPI00374C9E76